MSAKPPQAPKSDRARRKRRPWLWLGAAGAASLALLIGAWVIDKGRAPEKQQRTGLPPITDPIVPPPLTDAERGGTGTNIGKQQAVSLPKGAWVQVAGPDGRVKQQYTASDIHPLPDKRLSMDQPRAVLYGSQGRVVTMRSDSMTAKVPHRELESGRLVGNVVIRVYRAKDDAPVDLAVDAAEVVIEAPEAEFDMAAGEIRVDRYVRVTSEALTGEFEGLSLTLSQDGKSITRLEADRALSPIRIERSAEMLRKRGEGLRPAQTRRDDADGSPQLIDEALQFTAYCADGQNAAPPAAAGAPRAPRANPYLLKLFDNVKVVSTEKNGVITMTGDEMHVLFMMKGSMGEGLTDAGPARGVAVRDGGSARMVSSGAAAAGVVLPALPLAAEEEEAIVITYAGKLIMEPATPGIARLNSEEAVRLDMIGKPATVLDAKSDTTIRAPHVSFESGVEAVELNGDKQFPASLNNPKFGLTADRVTLNRTTGRGRVVGAGTLRLGKADAMPLNVEWGNQGTFTLEPGVSREPESTFRGAKFDGGVKVRRKDFSLDSDTLSVDAEGEGKSSVVRRIVADGGVTAADLGPKTGRMNAQRVEVLLEPDGEGGSRPKSLVATKGVVVADAAQTLWADSLRAAFVPAPKKPGGAGFEAPPKRKTQDAGDLLGGGGSVELGPVAAEGPVEFLMKDGTRIWADRMEGNAQVRTAQLHGPNVLVVRGNSVMDQMAEVSVQGDPSRLSSAGPGRMSYYTDRVIPESKDRMARPHLPQVPMMQATWREGLAFTEGAIPGKLGAPDRGLLLLQGAVKVRAARSAPEEEALDADEVHIETLPSGTKTASDMGQVAKMTALGNVRVQAQRWETAAKTGEPQFFRLQSQRAMYDTLTGLCSVDGSGNILINDPAWASKTPKDGSDKSPFSPNGITKFTWQRSLGMKALNSELTTIALDGSVLMEHVGPDDASTGTIAADHLEATVRKGAEVAGAKPAAKSDGAPMLGAGSTLEEVLARGKVVVRTSMYDVEAGELSLNELTQVATLTTTPGRVVTIQKRGEAIQRAQSAIWDMKSGIITIDKARGTIAR